MEGKVLTNPTIPALLVLLGCLLLTSAMSINVSSNFEAATETSVVLCLAHGVDSLEWTVSDASQNFQIVADHFTVLSSKTSPEVLYQGLTLSSEFDFSTTYLGLDFESRLIFDSSFPLEGSFTCSCTAEVMFSTVSDDVLLSINGANPTTGIEGENRTSGTNNTNNSEDNGDSEGNGSSGDNSGGNGDYERGSNGRGTQNGSENTFLMIVSSAVLAGVHIVLGLLVIMISFVVYKKKSRKRKQNNRGSFTRRPQASLVDNGLYNEHIRPQTHGNTLEPTTEPEYSYITNVGLTWEHSTVHTSSVSPVVPARRPEHLLITNTRQQQNTDIHVNLPETDSGRHPTTTSLPAAQLQNPPSSEDVSMTANPSYTTRPLLV